MTVSTLAPRARRRMQAPPPPDPVTQYALDVVAGRIVTGVYVRKACERHLRDLADGHTRGLRWEWMNPDSSVMTGQKAVQFFGLLRHYKGDLGREDGGKGAFIHLQPWQQFIVGAAFGWKREDGLRRFRSVYVEVAKKNGKALALDTPIPTPSGWTTMGEIGEGDALLDEHGQPCQVTFATPIMRDHDCYRVEFSDGSSVVADAGHQWLTEELRHRYRASVKTTADIAASITTRRDAARNHRIPVAGALVLPDADLTVDPYVLGVWLGDGDTGQAIITVANQDTELLQHVATAGVAIHARTTYANRTPRYRLGSTGAMHSRSEVAAALRGMGLIGNKHIPAAYLRASLGQRVALLQGLMDTDGHVTPKGQCEFTTTRPQIRDGFLELARSLGYKPTAREGVATIAGREIGPKWRIQFHGRRDRAPFRLARKLLRVSASVRDSRSTHRQIIAVVPVTSVPVRCIQVDSPSHLFLAGEAMVPTHNTLMGAGIALLMTFFDGEPGAEFYSLATKEDQAKLSWNDGAQFVAKNASIARQVRKVGKRLVNERSASFWMPLGRDSDIGDQGINPHGGLVDELHVLDSHDAIDNLETATSSRSQPMIWKITTAGVKRESVWADERADAISILEGRATDDSVLALVYTLDEGDDPFDEAVWPKSNPNLGVSVRLDTLREQAEKAKRSPGKMAAYLRFRMNVPTSVATRAIDITEWDANADEPILKPGRAGYAGLDLASVQDLTALLLLFRDADGMYDLLCRFWCPADGITERSRRDGVPYDEWVRDGYLIATPGNVTDYAYIRREIEGLAEKYTIGEVGFDRWNATQLAVELGQDGASMIAIPQTHAGLGPAWRELEKLILDRKLRHGGHPILRWMAGNVEVETDAQGNQKPSKRHSSERIDGIMALLMALSRWMANGDAPAIWTAA